MSSPTPSGSAALMTQRVLVGSLMAAVVFIALALFFVLGTGDDVYDVTPFLVLPLVIGALSFAASEFLGYRVPPIAPGTPRDVAEGRSRAAFQQATILRFALSESVAILGIAGAFVVIRGGFLLFLVAAVVGLVLMGVHCWPWERPIAKTQASLERTGGESYLREAYGLPAKPTGPIQKL